MNILKIILEEINKIWFWILEERSRSASAAKSLHSPKTRLDVRPSASPYYLEDGWQDKGDHLEGYYRCQFGAWLGWIEKRQGGEYGFFIQQPPEKIFSGPHRACFTQRDINWWHVHFKVNSQNIDSGIMAIERILYESLGGRK